MRFLLSFITALILVAAPASAEEVLVTTKVSRVELHPDGARIFRSFNLDLPAGRHRLEFRDIFGPENENFETTIGSLDIDFGGANVTLNGFSYKQDGIKPLPRSFSPEMKEVLAEYEAAQQVLWGLQSRKNGLNAEIKAAQAQLAYLDSIRAGSTEKNGAVMISGSEITANTTTIGQEYLAALQTIQKSEQAITEMEFDLAEAQSASDALMGYMEYIYQGEVGQYFAAYFDIELASAYSGPATVSMLSSAGSWQAEYELYLTQDGAQGQAVLQRKALIANSSASYWGDVTALLSTARINVETKTRDPQSRIGSVSKKLPPESTASSRDGAVYAPVMEPTVMVEESARGGVFLDGEPPVLKGQVLEFSLPKQFTAKPNSLGYVWLDKINLDVALSAKIVPARRQSAFLIARLRNTTSGPILPGGVFIYRDGAYIGEGQISAVGIGEEFELSFGEYDGIEVTRDLVEKFDSDIGIISSTNKRVLRYRTTITSNLGFAMPVRVLGGVPVSETEDLQIRMLASPQPTEKDVDGKRGVVAWEFDLQAGSTKRIDLGYEAQWPPDMEFTIR